MERDSQRIVRQWNREIEEELHRAEARHGGGQPWRPLVWWALWLLWLAVLLALFGPVKSLG